jgi:hypothetical protein
VLPQTRQKTPSFAFFHLGSATGNAGNPSPASALLTAFTRLTGTASMCLGCYATSLKEIKSEFRSESDPCDYAPPSFLLFL